MNKPQTIQTPSGDEMVIVSRAEYDSLVSALEDLEDALGRRTELEKDRGGEVELISGSEVDDYLNAPTPLAFWRKKRGLSAGPVLAKRVGVTQAYLSEIESGKKGSARSAC